MRRRRERKPGGEPERAPADQSDPNPESWTGDPAAEQTAEFSWFSQGTREPSAPVPPAPAQSRDAERDWAPPAPGHDWGSTAAGHDWGSPGPSQGWGSPGAGHDWGSAPADPSGFRSEADPGVE